MTKVVDGVNTQLKAIDAQIKAAPTSNPDVKAAIAAQDMDKARELMRPLYEKKAQLQKQYDNFSTLRTNYMMRNTGGAGATGAPNVAVHGPPGTQKSSVNAAPTPIGQAGAGAAGTGKKTGYDASQYLPDPSSLLGDWNVAGNAAQMGTGLFNQPTNPDYRPPEESWMGRVQGSGLPDLGWTPQQLAFLEMFMGGNVG
jgi:hypothetical protein